MYPLPLYKMARAEKVVVTLIEGRENPWWMIWRPEADRRLVTRTVKDRSRSRYPVHSDIACPAMYDKLPIGKIVSYNIQYSEGWDCSDSGNNVCVEPSNIGAST